MNKSNFDKLTKEQLQDFIIDLMEVVEELQYKLECISDDISNIDFDFDGYVLDDLLDKYKVEE